MLLTNKCIKNSLRYFIELSYNGSAYHGWQSQPNAITVQEVIEDGLSKLLKEKITIFGAGRTDAGVNALQMFAHFDYATKFDIDTLVFKLNSYLPKDIAIHTIFKVKEDAHARFNAESRTYIYRIATKKSAFSFNAAHYIKHKLDVEKMDEASKILYNHKNFKCFSRSNTDVKTYNCDIKHVDWRFENNELIFTITADRFLRNMVRAIVGTLLNIGTGKMTLDQFHALIKSEDRTKAGASAPGHALYLSSIEYPKSILL